MCYGPLCSDARTVHHRCDERFAVKWMLSNCFENTVITPHLMMAGLDETDPMNHRRIDNLSIMSKVRDLIINWLTTVHLVQNNLLPELQSVYRSGRSTQIAPPNVLFWLVDVLDKWQFAPLSLLDLSEVYDAVDHNFLLQRLSITFGIETTELCWFTSHLDDRAQSVHHDSESTAPRWDTCGVIQGSVLGPLRFTLYIANVDDIIRGHRLPH